MHFPNPSRPSPSDGVMGILIASIGNKVAQVDQENFDHHLKRRICVSMRQAIQSVGGVLTLKYASKPFFRSCE